MNYNEKPPEDLLERLFLDGLLHEYLVSIFYKTEIENYIDDISDRTPVSEHGEEELKEFNQSLELIRENIALVKVIFSNNAFRKR